MHGSIKSYACSFRTVVFITLLGFSTFLSADDSCSSATDKMEEAFASWVSGDSELSAPSVIYRLERPGGVVVEENAFGTVRSGGQPISVNTPFYIASMSKTMVAATTLKLMQRNGIGLDTKLGELGLFSDAVIEKLHVYKGQSFGYQLTLRHLLNHSSGMKDYLLDDRDGIGADSESGSQPGSLAMAWFLQLPAYSACINTTDECLPGTVLQEMYPGRPWTHWDAAAWQADPQDRDAGLLNYYLAEMAGTALFEPGKGWHYSDTNFMILGLLVEKLTGLPLGQALAVELFQPLGMKHSWQSHSGVSPAEKSPQAADIDVLGYRVLALNADMSWDWGGGGVVSTVADLTIFIRALMEGRIVSDPVLMKELQRLSPTLEDAQGLARGYGLGLGYIRDSAAGSLFGHTGAWGSLMFYLPELDMTMAATINKAADGHLHQELSRYLTNAARACHEN